MLSIVVPTLNEAGRIGALLRHLGAVAPGAEVVVVDGGSDDGTAAVARAGGARVVDGVGRGRGLQMNAGAAASTGDALLFLHADTVLPVGVEALVASTLEDPAVALGAFRARFDGRSPAMRAIEWGIRLRCRVAHLPFGDQALFLRRAMFQTLGGYREQFMEDAHLVGRARGHGRIVVLPDEVVTSARRWREAGTIRTTARNLYWTARFLAGV